MKIKKDDNVLVIAGKDKGKKGKVRFVYPKDHQALIEGVNIIKTHSKAKAQVKQAGIIEREAPINLSDLMLIVIVVTIPFVLVTKPWTTVKKQEFVVLVVRLSNNGWSERKVSQRSYAQTDGSQRL